MTAKQYINTLFQSITDLFESEPFNQCASGVFPESFMKTSRAIFKKLFRVYAHVYHNHLNVCVFSGSDVQEFTKLGAEAHLNTTFKHFILFDREFKMINIKEEVPLQKLIQRCFLCWLFIIGYWMTMMKRRTTVMILERNSFGA